MMRKPCAFISVVVMGLIFCCSAAADFTAGAEAYKKGDFIAAIKESMPGAQQGDAQSQWLLGSSYVNANSPEKPQPQQIQDALKWLNAAADQGHVRAMLDIGTLYMFYQETSDPRSAAPWFQRAAEHNNAEAQFLLGLMHFSGDAMPIDYVKAYMWWLLAARQGHPIAKQMLQKSLDVITAEQRSESEALAKAWTPKK